MGEFLKIANMIDLKNAEAVQKLAENRAERWVKAWGNQGEYAYNVKIDWQWKTIVFHHRYSDGIAFSAPMSIDLKYLDDDSTLERDSKERYKKESDERVAKFNRIQQLKQTKDVMELHKLEREVNPWHYDNQPKF